MKTTTGTFEYLRFQVEGQTCAVVGWRRLIATVICEPDVAEANLLRAQHDRVLVSAMTRRLSVWAYYVASSGLVSLLCRNRCAATTVYAGLNAPFRLLRMPR